MSQKDKLIQRLLSEPKDFSFQETVSVLSYFGYTVVPAGKTGGSRVAFSNDKNDYIRIHKPHPRSILKPYQVSNLIADLMERGLI